MEIRLDNRGTARWLAVALAVLLSLHGLGHFLKLQFGSGFGLVRFFDMNAEGTVPTYFSALLMLAAAGLLALLAVAERHGPAYRRWTWMLLAAVFVFLPYDELFAVHERLNGPLKQSLQTSGFLGFAWVLPYALFAAAVGGLTIRLLRVLPKRIRRLILAGGAIFVGGALGVEMIGARIAETFGMDGLAYFAATTVEEVLEMTGLGVFIVALVEHLGTMSACIRFVPRVATPPGAVVALVAASATAMPSDSAPETPKAA